MQSTSVQSRCYRRMERTTGPNSSIGTPEGSEGWELSAGFKTNNVCGRARKGELLYCRAQCRGRRKVGWRNQFTGQRCISVSQSAVAEIWPCRLMAAGPLVLLVLLRLSAHRLAEAGSSDTVALTRPAAAPRNRLGLVRARPAGAGKLGASEYLRAWQRTLGCGKRALKA